MHQAIPIALGAIVGANLRYAVGLWAAERFGSSFPYGTLVINVTGSFVLGLFLALFGDRMTLDPAWRLAVATGFCGGYTTFSAFSYEVVVLLQRGAYGAAVGYAVGSVLLTVLAAAAGVLLARLV